MDDYKRRTVERYQSLLVYGKRYKRELFILAVIIVGALLWGAFSEENKEHRHLPRDIEDSLPMADSETTKDETGTIVYNITSSLRSMPWREVLTSELEVSNLENYSQSMDKDASNIAKNKNGNSNTKNKDDTRKAKDEETNSRSREKEAVVTGIIVGEAPYVVIAMGGESKTMTSGEKWKTFNIVEINEQCVTINRGGQEVCLEVGESLVI